MILQVQNTKVGLQLKKARLEKGLSQEDVASKLGVTWEMISRYENGRSSALKYLDRFSEIYDKPVGYFLKEDFDPAESFTLENLVSKLSEQGVTYRQSLRNVVKLLDKLSGKGIDEDIKDSQTYVEISSYLAERFSDIFALKLSNFDLPENYSLKSTDIGFFAKGLEPNQGDIVIAYDGITYSLMEYDANEISATLAVLISVERSYRTNY